MSGPPTLSDGQLYPRIQRNINSIREGEYICSKISPSRIFVMNTAVGYASLAPDENKLAYHGRETIKSKLRGNGRIAMLGSLSHKCH